MKYAWVDDATGVVVAEVFGISDPEIQVAPRPGLSLVAADVGAIPAKTFLDGGAFFELPPAPGPGLTFDPAARVWQDQRGPEEIAAQLVEAKAGAARKFIAWSEEFLGQFTRDYPSQEVAAWSRKVLAARTVLAGGADPLIQFEADARGMPAADLAELVVAKGALFERIVAVTSAIRAQTQTEIENAATEADLAMILTAAMTRANAALAEAVDIRAQTEKEPA